MKHHFTSPSTVSTSLMIDAVDVRIDAYGTYDAAYDARHFSDEAMAWRKDDCRRQAEREAARNALERAEWAAYKKQNHWPTDATALRCRQMGLMELITERGD